MSDQSSGKPRRGVLIWVVAIIALVWNGMGCLNLVQQMTPEGLEGLPDDYRTFIETRPSWALYGFAASVGFGVFGAVFLIMGNRLAMTCFVISLLGALVALVPTLSSGAPPIIIGTALSAVLAAIFALVASRALRS